jgi:hypothetical protein
VSERDRNARASLTLSSIHPEVYRLRAALGSMTDQDHALPL